MGLCNGTDEDWGAGHPPNLHAITEALNDIAQEYWQHS